jgi:acetyl-CoA carboxylase biotin carboxyl carrier protein
VTCAVDADTTRRGLTLSRSGQLTVVRWSNRIWANTGWVTNGVMMAEDVRAEIVASVLEVVVSEGDQIGEGDTLVLLESMKMEIPVLAEVAGTISKVSVSVGDVIQAGDLIAVIS